VTLQASDLPLHRQLFVTLRDQIERGTYGAGSQLPSEKALCDEYGVSRITVRRALQNLTEEGLVERRRGVGTYVSAGHRDEAPAPVSFMEALRQTQARTSVKVVQLERGTPPGLVARRLQLDPCSDAVYVLRVRSSGTTPQLVTESWIPNAIAGAVLTRANLRRRALFELLQESGLRFGRITQEIAAEIADPSRARLLEVPTGSALMRIERLVHDDSGRPVQHSVITATPTRTRIVTEFDANDLDTVASGILAHRATIHSRARTRP
jgi:GntR family transcriptional regulator